jgi:hypothetical protein
VRQRSSNVVAATARCEAYRRQMTRHQELMPAKPSMSISAEKTVRLVLEPPATYGGGQVPGVAALEFCTR